MTGYTTGVYAAAASIAAARMLLYREKKKEETVALPGGEKAIIEISSVKAGDNSAYSLVTKKPNKDSDVTNGIEISVTTRFLDRETKDGIVIKGGTGVGTVTLPGLQVPVGKPAINPVPLQMIASGVNKLKKTSKADRSLELTVAVHNGEEIAKKTFNPKLGIVGGVSIIGTTGIVRPMSDDSWKESLLPQVDMSLAAGYKKLVLTFGNLGERAACNNGFSKRQIIQMSNFVGFILDACVKRKVEEVFLIGHLGKVIKIADGHLDTHSKRTKQNLSILTTLAEEEGLSEPKIRRLKTAKSGEAALGILGNKGKAIMDKVAEYAGDRLYYHTGRSMKVSVAITDLSGRIVGCQDEVREILKRPSKWGSG